MKQFKVLCLVALLSHVGLQTAQAQQTLQVYGFVHSKDSYNNVSYFSEVVIGVVNDKGLFDPSPENLRNQFITIVKEMSGKNVQIMNHYTSGFMYKRFTPIRLNGEPKAQEELTTESTLDAMKKKRAENIANQKQNGVKVVEVSNQQFQYIQPKR